MTSLDIGSRQTVVLGLGNPVRYDDAVGLRVAEAVERLLEREPVAGVTVLTSTRAGFDLIDLLTGAGRAIIIDCLVSPDAVPGRVRRLTLDDVAGAARLVGAHDITLAGAFELARALDVSMPIRVEIYAVEAADTDRIEEGMSPPVAAAVQALAGEIHHLLAAKSLNDRVPSGP
jgi:hydrogenase maturation protease